MCSGIRYALLGLFLSIINPINVSAEYFCAKNINLPADSLYLQSQNPSISNISIQARFAVTKNVERNGESKAKSRVVWNYQSPQKYCFVELSWRNTNYGDFTDTRQAILRLGKSVNGNDSIVATKIFDKKVNLSTGYNTIVVEGNEERFKVYVGADRLNPVGELIDKSNLTGSCGIISTVKTNVLKFIVESAPNIKQFLKTSFNEDTLKEKFRNNQQADEGFWSYLDRNNDAKYAIVGGRYRIALVKDNDDYLLIYLSGAQTNQINWAEGMIKGRLKPTIFQNHYDLIWYDSMFDIIDTDAYATIEDSILTLDFPLYKTQIRFYKEK